MKFRHIIYLAIILLLPILIYAYFFRDLSLGGPSEWGKFGDFYSGVLNPIITAITTLLLIYITSIIARRDETRQQKKMFFEYRLNVINKLMMYQQNLNNIKSRFWVKQVLIEAQICKNNENFDNLSFADKQTPQAHKQQKEIRDEMVFSIKDFYASVLYSVLEIKTYFENFENSHSLLFENNIVKKENYEKIITELSKLDTFLKNCLEKTSLSIPENITIIESELSSLITKLSNNQKINV